jgi:hydroxypyruvate isomerase
MAKSGRIRQSVAQWCFADHWDVEATVRAAKELGLSGIDLVEPRYFPLLAQEGLVCSLAPLELGPQPVFAHGFNKLEHHEKVIEATQKAIDACAAFGFENVVSFTGLRDGIDDAQGADNCVAGYKKIVGYAEQRKVTLCLELLNSRDLGPSLGHPDYQGDHVDYCIDIIRRVASPNLKFLFDVYHVQIMDGDLIRRIRQHREYIGHVHTGGNPGRGELDHRQEINYKSIMEALVEIGYAGFVGQEFIPTGEPLESLRQAVAVCDV